MTCLLSTGDRPPAATHRSQDHSQHQQTVTVPRPQVRAYHEMASITRRWALAFGLLTVQVSAELKKITDPKVLADFIRNGAVRADKPGQEADPEKLDPTAPENKVRLTAPLLLALFFLMLILVFTVRRRLIPEYRKMKNKE